MSTFNSSYLEQIKLFKPDFNSLSSLELQTIYNLFLSSKRGDSSGFGSTNNNIFNISKMDNPFSKQNATSTGLGMLGAVGGAVGGMIGGSNHSAVGDAMGAIGKVAGVIPGPWGAAISGGLLVFEGLTNAAFGSNLNDLFIAEKNLETRSVANDVSTATTSSLFLNDFNNKAGIKNFTKDDVGTDGWFSTKARDKYNAMIREANAAATALAANYTNTANNINMTNTQNQLYNVAAFGGNIFGNGSNFTTGMIHINNGDTHENSPYEGVPMGTDREGTPNLVEENETIYGDYVFSARLIVPKIDTPKKGEKLEKYLRVLKRYSGMSYADAAKKAEKNSGVSERPNDYIAKQGFEDILEILAQSQEKERAINEHKEAELELRNMSDEEFNARQYQQEQVQELLEIQALESNLLLEQLFAMLQLAGIDPLLFAQMSSELLQLIIALIQQLTQLQPSSEEVQAMLQLQAMQQLPQMAYGGIFANGGQMSQEELQAAQAQEQAQQQKLQQLTQQQVLSDLVNLLNLTTEQPLTEEAPKQELAGIDNGTPANEMSTSELNETIDLIYQYAKANGIKELAKRARKAKRASRDSKEDFVDDALEDIEDYEQQKVAKQQLQLVLEQQNTEVQLQLALQLQLEQAQLLSMELAAALELNSLMQDLSLEVSLFANGGLMSLEELLTKMKLLASTYSTYLLKNNPNLYQKLNTELLLYLQQVQQSGLATELDLLILPIQYLATKALEDLEFIKLISKLLNQYATGGSMNLNNSNSGLTTNGVKLFAGPKIKTNTNYEETDATKYKDFLKYLKNNNLNLLDFITYYNSANPNNQWSRKNYTSKIANEWIGSINKSNQENTARQYLDNLNYDLLVALAKGLKLDTNSIANDTDRDKSYRDLILNNTSDYNRYSGILSPYTILSYRADDWAPSSTDWTDSETEKIKGATKYQSLYFTGDNALKDLDTYYENRLSAFLKENNDKGSLKNGKVADNFYLTGQLARQFNKFLKESGDAKDKELANMFRMSHSKDTDWSGNTDWEYKNKYNTTGTVLENEDYRSYYSDDKNGGAQKNALKLDSLWGRKHSPKLDFLYEYTPVKERTAYYIDGKEIDASKYIEDGKWNNPMWTATATDDLHNEDGSIVHRYNLTLAALPTIDTTEDIGDSKTNILLDKYVTPSTLPLYGAAGLQAGLALYNMFTPTDTEYGDSLINAAKNAGLYTPITAKPLGNYVKYNPYDINYVNNQANASNLATIRQLLNASNGNTGALMAGLLALNYNYNLGIGNNYRLAMEYNDLNRFKTSEFNRATDLYNSEADLKALMANADALLKASLLLLDGLAKGYAMNQAAKDTKLNAINAGLSSAANMFYNAYQLGITNDLVAWRLNHLDRLGTRTKADSTGYNKGGKLRTRRNRGISF